VPPPGVGFAAGALFFSINFSGYGTNAGGVAEGWIRCAVTSTINSLCVFCALLLLNRLPMIGTSPNPGIFCQMLVTRLSRSPAITKPCPSCISNSVCARRVLRAGIVKPEICSALAKSNVLTSGATTR